MTHTRDRNTRRAIPLILLTCVLWLTGAVSSDAQTNITPTQGDLSLGTTVTTNGDTTEIKGGTRAGQNLFHSFDRFDVGAGATAQFQNTLQFQDTFAVRGPAPAPATANIFARVIGGQASQIEGTIRTNGYGAANLWFMNPSGIIFGPGAKLEIGGSANFTTAGRLGFSNGGFFTNNSTAQDIIGLPVGLSVADITSFGFFESASPIAINGSNDLAVGSGQTLSLVAGGISVVGVNLRTTNGAVRLTSVDGQNCSACGSVQINRQTGAHSYSSLARPGNIALGQGSAGKAVEISSRQIQLNTDTYSGTSATDFIGDLAGSPPMIVIRDGSLLVANLPRTQLIVSSPAVTALTPDPTTLDVGDNSNLNVTLNHAFVKPVDVRIASTDPTVASIAPSNITVPAGRSTAPVQVQGIAPGNTSVRAATGSSSVTASVIVNFVLPPFDSTLAPTPTTLVEGNSGTVTVTLNQPAPEDITVTFTSSDPTVLTAPRSVTISEGRTSANGSYTTLQPGSATVTASLQISATVLDTATSPSIRVNPLQLTSLSPNLTIQEGESGTLTLTLSQEAPRDIPVTFTSSNPTDVPAPAATTVPEGARTIPVPVEGVDDGRAIITASYEGDTAAATVLVNQTNFPGDGGTGGGGTGGGGTGGGGTGGGGTGGGGTFLGSLTGNSPVNQAVSAKTPADAKLLLPIPSPPPNRLVIASDRCSGGAKGEFSSFVQGGRDASRTQPGGLLASPLRFEDETPQISSIRIQPGELSVRAIGPVNVAPAAMAFLQRGGGC